MDTVRILICAVHGNEAFDGQRALCRWNCSRFLEHGNSQARGRPPMGQTARSTWPAVAG